MALRIDVSNCEPHPNGQNARMSRSANGNPIQAKWHATDGDYEIHLPAGVFKLSGGSPNFTVKKGETSAGYHLKPNAPTGEHTYSIAAVQADAAAKAGLPGTGTPAIMVDP